MLLRGFIDAIMMRSQQALAFHAPGYLPPEHYDQIFSAHGTIMIFFAAMPLMIGLMNFVVPLQLGVRDVAFPTLNSTSFWLTATGALLVNISLVVGEFARTGWLPYPPLSELRYSPGVGVDYYLWALQISGVGTLLTGINFVTTILKIRAPGMSYLRMPMFCWTALASNLLIVAAFPVLTATLAMLTARPLSRLSFFHQRGRRQHDDVHQPDLGLGTSGGLHPGAAGVRHLLRGDLDVLRQAAVRLPLDGGGDDVHLPRLLHGLAAPLLHDGRRRRRQRASSASPPAIIAVGTGVKIYNWLFTMYGGRIRFATPMLWSLGFIVTFVDRRHDRRAAGRAAGRFPGCTTACSWSPISTT